MQLGVQVITRLRAELVASARDNSLGRDWANPSRVDIRNCNVQPFILSEKYVSEIDIEREHVRQLLRCWVPPGTDILYTDRVLWRGVEYDVMGITGFWDDLQGIESHRTILLRERIG